MRPTLGLGLMAGAIAAAAAAMPMGAYAEAQQPVRPSRRARYSPPQNPRLNRSRHWDYAKSYQDARAMSPFPDRPVR